jgi:hypothetical protein
MALFIAYSEWCRDVGRYLGTQNAFGRSMSVLGYGLGRNGLRHYRTGLRLRPNPKSIVPQSANMTRPVSNPA